ncbi:MAG: RNA-binding cell elongation regulator Jag/EloR [Dethiobacteria bacterium]|jgi:spoIIIJ-associated protein
MISIEVSAKTVEEALEEGLKKLGVKKDNVQVEVLSEPAQGLFKFLGSKMAKLRLTVIKDTEEYIKDFLENIVHIIGVKGNINVVPNDEGNLYLEIKGEDLGVLIGKRGNTLNALQYLSNVVLYRQFASPNQRVIIDIENYRLKRKKTLENLARNLALKVLKTKKEVALEPMNPQERRIIHIALKNYRDVVTSSHGEEPYRKIVISPR